MGQMCMQRTKGEKCCLLLWLPLSNLLRLFSQAEFKLNVKVLFNINSSVSFLFCVVCVREVVSMEWNHGCLYPLPSVKAQFYGYLVYLYT